MLSNYTTKSDLKRAAGINTLKIVKKSALASLKLVVGKLDIDKLKTTSVKNEIVKKTVCDELFKKSNAIQTADTSDLVDEVPNHDKYITTDAVNKFSATIFDERLRQTKYATKNDLDTVKQRAIINEEKVEKLQLT